MQILHSIEECVYWRKSQNCSVGFVPTMGALHLGHLSLVELSKKHCSQTIVSIYVNPAQFSPGEDLDSYPKTREQDLQYLEQVGADAAFVPTNKEMYTSKKNEYFFDCDLSHKIEGQSRPRFFKGVTMVVHKLFSIVKPTHAIFGAKDAQQLLIIKKMIKHNNYGITLLECPTVRAGNGLALSSRNVYLTESEQKIASNIYLGLKKMNIALIDGERKTKILKTIFTEHLNKFSELRIDYISIACLEQLNEVDDIINMAVLVSTAVFLKEVRLIDNFSYFPST